MSYALGIPVPLDHFSDDVVTVRSCFAQLCDGNHCAALLLDHFQAWIPSYAAQGHPLENIQGHLKARSVRVEQAALVERARERFAHLSQYEAAQLTERTLGGYERYDAWDRVYDLVRTTVHVYDIPIPDFRASGSEEDQ